MKPQPEIIKYKLKVEFVNKIPSPITRKVSEYEKVVELLKEREFEITAEPSPFGYTISIRGTCEEIEKCITEELKMKELLKYVDKVDAYSAHDMEEVYYIVEIHWKEL